MTPPDKIPPKFLPEFLAKPMPFALLLLLAALGAGLAWWLWPRGPRLPGTEEIARAYAAPLPPPEGPIRVYFLGHSLIGRDMPAMLAQLAGPGHGYESQLGWGASLRDHWEPDVPVNGFAEENAHPRFRPARAAIESGAYDAVVLTEMVEIRDAIRYHDSPRYFAQWADLAWQADPDTRVYLYETWHPRDDPEGWLARIDADRARYWENGLVLPVLARAGRPVHIIPGGPVLAAFTRAVEGRGGVGNIASRDDLFGRRADGSIDTIHLNDLGAYLIALTHYAVLYGRSPVGLPHALNRADGSPARAPAPETARLMQETVWQVVTADPRSGVAGG